MLPFSGCGRQVCFLCQVDSGRVEGRQACFLSPLILVGEDRPASFHRLILMGMMNVLPFSGCFCRGREGLVGRDKPAFFLRLFLLEVGRDKPASFLH